MIRCSPTQRTFQGNPGVFSFPVHEAECGPCEDPGVFICRSVIRAAAGLLLTKPHHMPVYLHKKHLFKCFPERAPELTLLPRSMHFYTELPISIWPSYLLKLTDVHRCLQIQDLQTENLHPFGLLAKFVFFPWEARSGPVLVA